MTDRRQRHVVASFPDAKADLGETAPRHDPAKRHRLRRRSRRGATMLEAALTLPILLTLLLGTLDLGLAVFRSHLLSFAARAGVRQTIVRGEFADELGSWGPQSVDEDLAGSTHPVADKLRPYLVGVDLEDVRLQIDWPDGHNRLGGRVRVTLSTSYTPMVTFLFGALAFPLQASSTMPIAH